MTEEVTPDIVVIGEECFTDTVGTVISYKGANYYKACDEPVQIDGELAGSFCVLRVDHGGMYHEDFDGNKKLRVEADGEGTFPDLTVVWPRLAPFGIPVSKTGVKSAWEAYVDPLLAAGDASMEGRILRAVMRHVYAAMPEDEASGADL